MAPRSRDPDQPGISPAVRAKRLKMQEIGRQMDADPVWQQRQQQARDRVLGPRAGSSEASPPTTSEPGGRSVVRRPVQQVPPRRSRFPDERSPEEIEREENLTMAVDPRTGRLPFGLYSKPEDDPYDPRFRGTQTEEGMAHVGALPEDEREYLHLGKPGTRPSGIPLGPRQPVPPLSQPPIGKPSVPSGPPVRAPRGGGAARPSVPGGIGSLGPERLPPRPIAPTLRPDSPFRYQKGGKVSGFGFASGGGTSYGKDYRKGK